MKRIYKCMALVLILMLTLSMSLTPAWGAADTNSKTDKTITGVQETTITLNVKEVISKANKTSVNLTWEKSKGFKVDYYQVSRKLNNGKYQTIFTTKSGAKMQYSDGNVKKGSQYTYRVRGVRKVDGKTCYTQWSQTRTLTILSAAKLASAVKSVKIIAKSDFVKRSNGKLAVRVNWSKTTATDVDCFRIYRSTNGKNYKLVKTTKDAEATTYLNTSVKNGQKYFYKVRGLRLIQGKTYYTKWSAAVSTELTQPVQALKVVEVYSKIDGDKIVSDYIASPRELDDYHDIGAYKNADVPYEISELRIKDSETAQDKYEALYQAISDDVYAGFMKNQAVFLTGSENETSIGAAGAVRRAFPDAKIGVVYLDAHGDLQISDKDVDETALATIMGLDQNTSKAKLWSKVSGNGAPFNSVLLSDGRSMSTEAKQNFETVAKIADYSKLIDTKGFNDASVWKKAVAELAKNVDVIYLHIDADVLHQAYVPHIDAGEGEGPIIWTMLENIETVMNTGKVAAVNITNMYTEETKTALEQRGFTIPDFPETDIERVNRFSMPSILSAVRMVTTTLSNYKAMPLISGAKTVIPKQIVKQTNFDGLKVVEINTRNQTGGVLVGRRAAAPMATDGLYAYEDRGALIKDKDHLFIDKVGTPREINDWDLCGIYAQAASNVEIDEIWMTDERADAEYPQYTRYEALCREISNSVYQGIKEGKAVAVAGSGCMPVPGVAGGLRRAVGNDAKIGIIYIDAHGDINTADSTYSGGIGGMDLSPALGIDKHPNIQHWWEVCADGLEPIDDLMHACGRDMDSGIDEYDPEHPYEFGEMINLKAAVSNEEFILSVDEFNDKDTFQARLAEFAKNVDVIYLHIDMDALDGAFMPNAGTPVGYNQSPEKIGPSVWTVMERVQAVVETGKVAVVNLASTYGDPEYQPERLLRQGFIYPTVEGEDQSSEYARNRANTTAIVTGMRVFNAMLKNWTISPAIK